MFDRVVEKLQISNERMQKDYNKNIRFNDYEAGNKVLLKTKYYKTGENRKLSPRRNGPWTVIRKLPNGVNFEIRNDDTREKKVVHHDRLTPVKSSPVDAKLQSKQVPRKTVNQGQDEESSATESGSEDSEYEAGSSDSDPGNVVERRYPQRNRIQRHIPGAVPWSAVDMS